MKHLGKYGFTYDSKADEWAAWAWSCIEHNPPPRAVDFWNLAQLAQEYGTEARHSPTQQQNTIGIGATTTPPPKAPLWPVLALSVVAGIIAIVLVWG